VGASGDAVIAPRVTVMKMRVGVLGAGSWGTTVAHLCAHNLATILYCRRGDVAQAINARHENPRYLPRYQLHRELRATTDLTHVASTADVLVMGVPVAGFRATLRAARPHVKPDVAVVSLAKGLDVPSRKRMTELVRDELPNHRAGVLSGPNLAKEILDGGAAAAVIAFEDETIARNLQKVFSTNWFRVYTNPDVVGVEIGGAVKNIIALAAGIADGLGCKDNTRAALMTRGLAEMTRLGVALGANPATFAGLAGMGDLIATCMSTQSRNRYVGREFAYGRSIAQISADMDQIAEGIETVQVVVELADQHGVYMPICAAVHKCIQGKQSAEDAYHALIAGELACEWP